MLVTHSLPAPFHKISLCSSHSFCPIGCWQTLHCFPSLLFKALDTSDKKVVSPTESFEDEVFPPCRVVLVPSSSFGKDICQDLTDNGVSSTPADASVRDSPAVFLFGEKEEEEGARRKEKEVEETCRKITLTLDENYLIESS